MKRLIYAAAGLGLLAVILGAFGAHALERLVPAEAVATFNTGVRYQFYHALAIGWAAALWPVAGLDRRWLNQAAACWAIGSVAFSGSIYLLALRTLLPFGVGWLGPVTPVGGLFFILGWACIGLAARTLTADA